MHCKYTALSAWGDLTALQDNAAWQEHLHDAFHDRLEEGVEGGICCATPHRYINRIVTPSLLAHIYQVTSAGEEILSKLVETDSHHPERPLGRSASATHGATKT